MKSKEIPAINLGAGGVLSFQIRTLTNFSYSPTEGIPPEAPHRHNFQELIWIKSGQGTQSIDWDKMAIEPSTFYMIATGQVHQFLEAENIFGFVLRFSEAFIPDAESDSARYYSKYFFNNFNSISIPNNDHQKVTDFNCLLSMMVKESVSNQEPDQNAVLQHLLQVLLIKITQNLDCDRSGKDTANLCQDSVFSGFITLLEKSFKVHHDVTFYARLLAVTLRQLSDRTKRIVGKTAKQVIEERIVLEAKRELRFTGMPVKEVAYDLGYDDPSYFSKVFKKVTGFSPQEYQAL